MVEQGLQVKLIEVNTNPCLETPCGLLEKMIPGLLDHALRLSLDLVYPPPCHYPNSQKHLAPGGDLDRLKWNLLYDDSEWLAPPLLEGHPWEDDDL
jgi:tubulin--tyrosine ligase